MKIQLGFCTPYDTDDSDEFTASELNSLTEADMVDIYPPTMSGDKVFCYRTEVVLFPEGNDTLQDIASAVAPHWEMTTEEAMKFLINLK
jgi:hypothetical protein